MRLNLLSMLVGMQRFAVRDQNFDKPTTSALHHGARSRSRGLLTVGRRACIIDVLPVGLRETVSEAPPRGRLCCSMDGRAMPDLPNGPPTDAIDCAAGREIEVIKLLLEEYRILRAERTQRRTNRVQVGGLAGVLAALLIASELSLRVYVVGFLVVIGAYVWWRDATRGLERTSERLYELERQLNRLAAQGYGVTRDVFRWEQGRDRRRVGEGKLARAFGWLSGRHTAPAESPNTRI